MLQAEFVARAEHRPGLGRIGPRRDAARLGFGESAGPWTYKTTNRWKSAIHTSPIASQGRPIARRSRGYEALRLEAAGQGRSNTLQVLQPRQPGHSARRRAIVFSRLLPFKGQYDRHRTGQREPPQAASAGRARVSGRRQYEASPDRREQDRGGEVRWTMRRQPVLSLSRSLFLVLNRALR